MKDIVGYEENYQIDKDGNVFSKKYKIGKALSYSISNTGYKQVNLYKNGKGKCFFIHSLMAITYLNHKPKGMYVVVDHIDGNKLNNSITNLRVITGRENTTRAKVRKYFRGVKRNGKRFAAQIEWQGKRYHLGTFDTPEEASEAYQKKLTELQT